MRIIFILSFIAVIPTMLFAHCEIPCGIYHDRMRIHMIEEHITTIEKSMKLIIKLSDNPKNYNQLVRWIMNKEQHADKISDIVKQYFMTQRLKPVDESNKKDYKKYVHKLVLLHKILVYNMKCKQTTDLKYIAKLRDILGQFENAYFLDQVAHNFMHVVEAYRKKDIDTFFNLLDKENRYKIGKVKFKMLFKNDREYKNINGLLEKALKKLEEGTNFKIRGNTATLRYTRHNAIKMVFEDGKWLLNDFE